MDIRMPGKKGNEVANRMRTIPALKAYSLVIDDGLIRSPSPSNKNLKSADGVDAIISKPLPAFDELQSNP